MMVSDASEEGQTAVLCSAGLDSAVLLAEEAAHGVALPVYIAAGLAWEAEELSALDRLLRAPVYADRVRPPVRLQADVRDVYPATHWAIRGTPPAYATPDEDVYLVGRNVVLLSKAAVLCAVRGIHRIAIGPLAGNPFPDASAEFFAAMSRSLSLGLAHRIEIAAPFASLHKAEVIRRGAALGVPFALTLSCMNPRDGQHCGACSKCRERKDGFREAGIEDPAP